MIWSYLQHPGILAFAHRGGNLSAPENTVGAFQHAVDAGYRYLETDVHLTRDGILVAFHDAGLSRVAGLNDKISENAWADLRAVDLGDGHRIPTLDQLLETFPEARFNIDPKSDDAVTPLADALSKHDALDRVGVGSFHDSRLHELRRLLGPELCSSPGPRDVLRLASRILLRLPANPSKNLGYGCVQLPKSIGPIRLNHRLINGFHQLGLQVHVWTINERAEMNRLLNLGVDGIMSDDVVLLREVLQQRGQWSAGG